MKSAKRLRGVCIGAGYFSGFQYEAWGRIPEVEIVAFANRDQERGDAIAKEYGIKRRYTDYVQMFDEVKPDFVDVITPPGSHREICREAGKRGIDIICQKPLAPTLGEATTIVEEANTAGVRFMVHENFRFQPWHRKLRQLIDDGAVGSKLHTLNFRTRTGDGWGDDAYLARQPYFREYPRLLIYETGVHFIDTFRYLGGDMIRVTAWLRRLNPVIKGEDCGQVVFEFENGALGTWDANRYNEPNCENARYTFGEFLIEGDAGSLRLYPDGRITLQKLGEPETEVPYDHEPRGFAGDCCHITQRHFIDRLIDGEEFETSGEDYLKTLGVQEAIYQSNDTRSPIDVANG
jgi:D-apiose dehydrogenase